MSNDGFWERFNARVNSPIITLSQLLIFFMTDKLSIFILYIFEQSFSFENFILPFV